MDSSSPHSIVLLLILLRQALNKKQHVTIGKNRFHLKNFRWQLEFRQEHGMLKTKFVINYNHFYMYNPMFDQDILSHSISHCFFVSSLTKMMPHDWLKHVMWLLCYFYQWSLKKCSQQNCITIVIPLQFLCIE